MAAEESHVDLVPDALVHHSIGVLANLAFTERAAVEVEAARGLQGCSLGQAPLSRALPRRRRLSGNGRRELRGPLNDRPDHSAAKRLLVSGGAR